MMLFWLSALVMVLVALLFIMQPMIRYRQAPSTHKLAADWYQSRLVELQKEFDAGQFSQEEFNQAVTELKLTAKAELQKHLGEQETGTERASVSSRTLLAILLLFVTFTAVFYWQNGHYQKLQDWQNTLQNMRALSQKVIQNSDEPVTMAELQEFALGLRTKLMEKEEAIGWMLLGRTLLAMNDVEGAIDAFEKSYKMEPSNASNTVSLAQALQQTGEEFELNRSLRLLREALQYQPNNTLAILLFAEGSMLLERYEVAKQGFELGLTLLEDNDPRLSAIEQRLAFIEEKLGVVQISGAELKLIIDISPKLKGQLSKFSHLFVFAKSDAMPMPLAVKKLTISEFPVSVSLSDSDVMVPDLSLSSQAKVNLFARLSLDADAPYMKGDWQGQVASVDTNNKEVIQLVIDEENK